MSLVKCLECGHQISTEAKYCPNCGAKREYSIGKTEGEAVGIKLAGLILFLIGTGLTIYFYIHYADFTISGLITAFGLILLFKKTNVRK